MGLCWRYHLQIVIENTLLNMNGCSYIHMSYRK
nr:MAG TPA: hypothetical protein [Caudoviricetes sp.]